MLKTSSIVPCNYTRQDASEIIAFLIAINTRGGRYLDDLRSQPTPRTAYTQSIMDLLDTPLLVALPFYQTFISLYLRSAGSRSKVQKLVRS